MLLQTFITTIILLSKILDGSANHDTQSTIFKKCCDSGKIWFRASENNACDSFPQSQLLSNLGSLSYDGNIDYLVGSKTTKFIFN